MSETADRIMMMFSIITRGKAKKYMESLNKNGIGFHMQTTAVGTAPSEMMDIFGLGTNDKDIVVSFAPESIINSYVLKMTDGLSGSFEYGGLMICVRLSAISRLTSELVNRASKEIDTNGGKKKVKSGQKHQLILVSVNQGYTDAVMETARSAGAIGGTVLRARLADSGLIEQIGDAEIKQEREIITIFAPAGTAAKIMEEVNRNHGALSEANGMVMALPVDKAYKI
ncbi:MAG: hypothetical protein IKA84_05875 [Clostridia bacterium]|nr:hypothetical protein [Clostridia bacterium]